MIDMPSDLQQQLRSYGQEHLLRWWPRLTEPQRHLLLHQLQCIDLALLRRLHDQRDQSWHLPRIETIQPMPLTQFDRSDADLQQTGEEALRRGEVAALVVAGGQGTRLGHPAPKGLFPVGPISGKSLFQLHAEKVLALQRRYKRPMPLLVMTSPATDCACRRCFADQQHFGLQPEQVLFFCQGTMPAVDLHTGHLLLEEPGKLFVSPNGHGGVVLALSESGLLAALEQGGIRHLFYFQVDNPLVKIADPLYLGQHISARAEVSSKVIPKQGPTDKLGNLVLVNGRCAIIEYSDLPVELAQARGSDGGLLFRLGNPALHIFDVAFLQRVAHSAGRIPFHLARKKVPHINEAGERIEPTQENALKFEMFIFDLLPLAERWTVVATSYAEEFAPLKNETGKDSPDTVRRAISNQAARWLQQAGVAVPADASGEAAVPLEISPLFALDAAELATKVAPGLTIDGPTYCH